jgi:hypothetical protein
LTLKILVKVRKAIPTGSQDVDTFTCNGKRAIVELADHSPSDVFKAHSGTP